MFQDEAGFGRINKPGYCWCEKKYRPCVPCHHIREYPSLSVMNNIDNRIDDKELKAAVSGKGI